MRTLWPDCCSNVGMSWSTAAFTPGMLNTVISAAPAPAVPTTAIAETTAPPIIQLARIVIALLNTGDTQDARRTPLVSARLQRMWVISQTARIHGAAANFV